MLNQPSSKEGEQQTDEKVNPVAEESQVEPALPPPCPPPSLDPSSSSSVASLSSHDQTHSNIVSASLSGDPIAAQLAQLFSIVGRLASENEAHLTSFARVNTKLASLKSENQALRRTVEDQDRVIAELSRAAIPDGHWVWETEKVELERARGKDGRWLFSLEKYKLNPPRIAAGPPTSLLSLPVELLRTTFELVEPDEERLLLPFFYISFRVAEVLSSIMYRFLDFENPKVALLYLEGRTSADTPKSPRITSLFVPQTLNMEMDPDEWSDDQLQALQRSRQVGGAPFDVNWLHVFLPRATDFFLDTSLFFTVARSCFNPSKFGLLVIPSLEADQDPPPSCSFIPLSSTLFLSTWTRLKQVDYSGEGSIILLDGDAEKETVFSRHWRAEGQRPARTRVETERRVAWGAPEDSVTIVEVEATPYEWVEQFVAGEETMGFLIMEEIEDGGEDGDDLPR